MFNSYKSVALILPVFAVALGCADDELPTEAGPACKEPPCSDEDSNDDVGDGDGDKPIDDERFCSTWEGHGERTIYQCTGHLTVTIAFNSPKGGCPAVLGEHCTENHEFGISHDPYESTAVLACCDAEGTPEDDLLRYCAMDLVEQVCFSIPKRVEAAMKDVPKLFAPQAKNLLNWLNAHQQDCYDALHTPGSPGVIGPVTWKVNGGDNKHWKLLEDFTITLDKAVVDSASLPESEADYLSCEDTTPNDGEIFESPGPVVPLLDVDVYQLGDSASVPIKGPSMPDGGRVWGLATATSQSLCVGPCSSLAVGEADGMLLVDDLNIFADGASVTMGDMQLDIDRLALRLYGVVQARPYHGNNAATSYSIDPGAAHFRVTGNIGTMSGTRWVTNATPIVVHKSDGGWTLEAFTVEHTDGLGGTWQAAVPLTTWN